MKTNLKLNNENFEFLVYVNVMFSNKISTVIATGLLCAYMAFPLSFLLREIDPFNGFQFFAAVIIALYLNKKIPSYFVVVAYLCSLLLAILFVMMSLPFVVDLLNPNTEILPTELPLNLKFLFSAIAFVYVTAHMTFSHYDESIEEN